MILSADVANEAYMQAVITQVYERFGTLHGVIHAAGIVGEKATRTIPEIGYIESEWQFQPKVHGVYVLEGSCGAEGWIFVSYAPPYHLSWEDWGSLPILGQTSLWMPLLISTIGLTPSPG